MICERCGNPLEASGDVYNGNPVPQNELYITLGGGYGSFVDPIDRGGEYVFRICHDCAMLVAALFPTVMEEHHTSLVPCSCPEYQDTKKRFDEQLKKQEGDWADHKLGHPQGESDCMYCAHPEGEELGEILHEGGNADYLALLENDGGDKTNPQNPWNEDFAIDHGASYRDSM